MSRTYLVDASPYLFRAFFALPDSIRTPQGEPANAVHGFSGFLVRLLNEEQPARLALAFDRSLTTSFRNDFYPAYKSSRATPPPDLVAQLAWCEELGAAMGARVYGSERYEADDILATLCHHAQERGEDVVVVTNDKDLAQLVTDHVEWFDFAKQLRYGPAEVIEKFGVAPQRVIDFQGLCGDKVDDIPGVAGIGKKSAAALVQHFGTLEALYERLDEVETLPLRGAKALRAKLEAGREHAFVSKRLARAVADMDLPRDDLTYRGAHRQELEAVCDRLGFKGLLDRVPRFVS